MQSVTHADSAQRVVYKVQAFTQGGANRVGELNLRGAGSALTTVHRDKVRCEFSLQHGLADAQEFSFSSKTKFESYRFASGEFSQCVHEFKQPCRFGKGRMIGRRNDIFAKWDMTNFSNFLGNFSRR